MKARLRSRVTSEPPTKVLGDADNPPTLELAKAGQPKQAAPDVPDLPACTPEAEGDVAVQELLGFDASLVPDLPLPTTLVCATDVVGEVILFTTSRAVFVAARKMHIPAFAGSELQLVLLGAEHDRVFAWHVRDWARARITDPGHKLDRGTVIGPVAEVLLPQHWPLRRALRRLGLMLSAVHVGDELPAVLTAEGGAP